MESTLHTHSLGGGFSQAPQQSARAFRAIMNAMARPGSIETLAEAQPPAPMSQAAGALALVLLDHNTPLYLAGDWDCPAVREWITFHTSAPFASAEDADFAFGDWAALQPLSAYRIGTPEYPDRSATLVVEMPTLTNTGATLTGPGIKDSAQLNLPDVPALQANAAQFPLGFDLFFSAGDQLAALPRSTKVRTA
ncbi:MAG: phosphonate C-P lyase system protein PhnH [Pseudomonadota bacterium]|nr:phosphonate C-P lyase system protein PhnH [Pseudomonadota bacterium]MEC8295288.1 phosphonate C-P lyase system protein PhnH [Pseudomonadota bacterium]